jgi:hypothetical protein
MDPLSPRTLVPVVGRRADSQLLHPRTGDLFAAIRGRLMIRSPSPGAGYPIDHFPHFAVRSTLLRTRDLDDHARGLTTGDLVSPETAHPHILTKPRDLRLSEPCILAIRSRISVISKRGFQRSLAPLAGLRCQSGTTHPRSGPVRSLSQGYPT